MGGGGGVEVSEKGNVIIMTVDLLQETLTLKIILELCELNKKKKRGGGFSSAKAVVVN